MKHSKTSRILAAVLALTMMFALAVTAFADGGYQPGAGTGSLSSSTPSSSGGSSSPSKRVIFVPDTGYTLTAKAGTSQKTDGSVEVSISGNTVPEGRVPDAVPADSGYKVSGWAIMGDDGKLQTIDIKTYEFKTSGTKVYAIAEDIWQPYKDMAQDRSDWYYTYVRDLSIAKVIDGYPGYIFQPKGEVTWGAALKLIMLATGYDAQTPTGTHWASGYLTKALADGLVTEDQKINLDAPLTRLEYARVAYKALGLKESKIATPFSDTDDTAVLALYEAKIVEGTEMSDGTRQFAPNDNITRAQISTVIWRINNYRAK